MSFKDFKPLKKIVADLITIDAIHTGIVKTEIQ